jgi:3,4-dihydroxy 2-butanone 4-phosphate synthase/GTP cyclohydrolase II
MTQLLTNELEQFRTRGFVILHDDFAAPFRGVIVAAAQNICAETVNKALHLTSGLCFVALSRERAQALMLSPMQRPATSRSSGVDSRNNLAMCLSVEAREGVTTGISASDRATTIQILGEETPVARKLIHPGHIFPIEAKAGGVLVKNSLTEAALDIVVIAGFNDAALYLDLLNPDGEFLSPEEQRQLSKKEAIPLIQLSELVHYRLQHEPLISRVAEAKLPSFFGEDLRAIIFRSLLDDAEHLAIVKGVPQADRPTIIRVQTEATFSDVFGGDNPPTRAQIHAALRAIEHENAGVVLYLRGTSSKQLKQQIEKLNGTKSETPPSLMREYGLGAQILRDLGVKDAIILSNSAGNLIGLESFGIRVIETRPLNSESTAGIALQ